MNNYIDNNPKVKCIIYRMKNGDNILPKPKAINFIKNEVGISFCYKLELFKNGIKFGQTSGFRFDEDGKYGDLVTNIMIAIDLPDVSSYTNINGRKFGYCNGVGNAIAQNIYL
jgi:hypothetical protein